MNWASRLARNCCSVMSVYDGPGILLLDVSVIEELAVPTLSMVFVNFSHSDTNSWVNDFISAHMFCRSTLRLMFEDLGFYLRSIANGSLLRISSYVFNYYF